MSRRVGRVGLLAVIVAVAACGGDDSQVRTGAENPDGAPVADTAWVHHGQVEGTLAGNVGAVVVEDAEAWRQAWVDHRFEGEQPAVDFDTHVVLLIGQAGGGCVDELIGLDVVDGQLEVKWLPPAGPCNLPLIMRIHAAEVHRGHLPIEFTYGLSDPFEDELEQVTIVLPPFDGEAPPPSQPPQAMSDAEVDAVFADHPVQRCTDDMFWWRAPNPVDGPLSNDPEVAEAQRERADFGVASDEATVRALLDDPPPASVADLGFPLTPEEWDLEQSVTDTMDRVSDWLHASAWKHREDYVGLIDRGDGIRPAVIAGEQDAAALQADLDAEFGPGTVTVHTTAFDPAAVVAVQDTVTSHIDELSKLARVTVVAGPPGPAAVGLVDPTIEALDAIADLVDPSLVCIEVERSGVRPTDEGS